jgi:CRISPR-associated protein Csm2
MASNYGGGASQRPGSPGQGYNNDRYNAAPAVSISVDDIKLQVPLSVNLFDSIAKDKAATVAMARKDNLNESTQLRKFYDELVMWFDKVHLERTKDAKASKYTEVAPYIKMMNAKVAYAKGRNHVDDSFEAMFSHCIKSITDAETLKHAKLFMEAFMGFYKAQEK